ncbi:DUF3883 domain-containing protein [uncultured Bacteroides sp.]|uniref:DUF3883 domain-containing protein n=1 Tax=uncultured Bacteroides sp. TaxID=162156 RepID=UPI0026036F60|nr:DUF3883 domain-containing protein [uncultured Bacteroides sp.]
MNRKELIEAIDSFDIKRYNSDYKYYESLRNDFVQRFSVGRILRMSLDEYVIGKNLKKDNFCYELERALAPLGKIVGATSSKFGIYYNQKEKRYKVSKMWDSGSLQKSFDALKKELISLINAGKSDDIDIIRSSKISPMFKGKILSTYYPQKYLSIFSEDHLDYFIQRLELDHKLKENSDIFDKRNVLLNFKNCYSIMSTWSLNAFSHFLYTVYPGSPKSVKEIGDYYKGAEMMDGDFESFDDEETQNSTKGKTDYDAQNKAKKQLGERGEYVVVQYETKKVKNCGIKGKPIQKSLYDDTLGYDIISYDSEGTEIYIEVKATNLSPRNFHFYFTRNELDAAKKYRESYHVYIVFNPNNAKPKIYDIGNPFMEKDKVKLIPITYKINIHKI